MCGSKLAFLNLSWFLRALILSRVGSSSVKPPSSKNAWFLIGHFELVMVSQSIHFLGESVVLLPSLPGSFTKCVVPWLPFRIGRGLSEHWFFCVSQLFFSQVSFLNAWFQLCLFESAMVSQSINCLSSCRCLSQVSA